MEYVQLVDERDNALGAMEKLAAHKGAHLHRAVSVFVFNSRGELLLQQRAAHKYHSGALWTNTCCTHPRPQEAHATAALRRLKEEMGLSASLNYQFPFLYRAELDHELTEYEYDHIYFAESDELPEPNPEEVMNYSYLSLSDIESQMKHTPEAYTEWFKLLFDRIKIARS
ncbi:isopentenyl-diphosphate Delta-isomerase [Rurimicrobium arvi]|uniref:Isopentenyl-diphosphate delta-isomerase n=1 Tax=Rurimicrobium arvi TaxID=2049916 RepID=A0ABP8MET3_9BACT